jgi:hypothetical protein
MIAITVGFGKKKKSNAAVGTFSFEMYRSLVFEVKWLLRKFASVLLLKRFRK